MTELRFQEEIDVNKTNLSKQCDIGHCWYFNDISFKYEKYLCNECHDLMQEDMSYNKGSAYKVNFWYMSKNDSVNIMNGSSLVDKRGILSIFFITYKNE